MSCVYFTYFAPRQFVGTWQEYVQSLISAGTIRESEKATFKKFTHLLVSHYAKLEAQAAERRAPKRPTNKKVHTHTHMRTHTGECASIHRPSPV